MNYGREDYSFLKFRYNNLNMHVIATVFVLEQSGNMIGTKNNYNSSCRTFFQRVVVTDLHKEIVCHVGL